MKKILSVLLAVMILAASAAIFTGCDSEPNEEDNDENNTKSFKVGAIYINGKNDTAGYTFAHNNGITKAMKALNLDPAKDLVVLDNIPEDETQVSKSIEQLVGDGCNIIFGISVGYMDAFEKAASNQDYEGVIFSPATVYKSNDKNFNNYFGRIYQARYLAGIAAGMKSLEIGNNIIGYVAAHGTDYAETCSGINAFAMGCLAVNPNAEIKVNNIHTWGDETKEKQAAETLIDTYKCGVVAQHCDSAQPQIVAQTKNVFGCGYNSDMTEQAPKAHLTAPVWNWDVYYKLAIETAMNDPANYMTKVGNYYGGLKEGFVDISPLSENCSEGTAERIDAVRKLIVDGSWDVFSGVKLSFDENGAIVKTDAALMDNAGKEIVAAGGASVDDGVITGSMNYYVAGVTEAVG